MKYATEKRKAKAKRAPKMKRAPKRSGWIKATAVKFVTRNGRKTVLVRKPATTKRRKRR